jgi:hypothetical protein
VQTNQTGKSSATKKWLIGCGIGCGAIIVIAALLVTLGVLYVRNLVEGFKDSEAMLATLTERYGKITDYTPDPTGRIARDRVEAFLAAREATAVDREKIVKSLQLLSDDEDAQIDVESPGGVLQKLKMGFGLIPQLADFFKTRNQALLDVGMGMGEYTYLYTIVYFAWLGKPVSDGPSVRLTGENQEFRTQSWEDDQEARELSQDITLRRLHRMLLPILRNQRDQSMQDSSPAAGQEWKDALSAEVAAMEADRYRLAWQDGLPDVIASSLEPYRERLEASYDRWMNAIEFSFEQ